MHTGKYARDFKKHNLKVTRLAGYTLVPTAGLCAKTIVPNIAADGSPPRRQVPEQRLVQGAVCVCGVRSCEHNVLAETAGPTATWEPVRLETRTLSLT